MTVRHHLNDEVGDALLMKGELVLELGGRGILHRQLVDRIRYEIVYAHWPEPRFSEVLSSFERNTWINQAYGPVTLLIGEDL